jgi:hypothetical protein
MGVRALGRKKRSTRVTPLARSVRVRRAAIPGVAEGGWYRMIEQP